MLKLNDNNEKVFDLQIKLVAWGSKERPMKLDGDFGITTEQAVKRFQEAHGLISDGIVGDITLTAIHDELNKHPFEWDLLLCKCNQFNVDPCGGFGKAQFKDEYLEQKIPINPVTKKPLSSFRNYTKEQKEKRRTLERFHKYEYPGIDAITIWAMTGLAHRADFKISNISRGYACWNDNEFHKRSSTNHMGKALDFWSDKITIEKDSKGESLECKRIRKIGVDECGFQVGWGLKNTVSFEPAFFYNGSTGALTWVHIDSRTYEYKLRRMVQEKHDLITLQYTADDSEFEE